MTTEAQFSPSFVALSSLTLGAGSGSWSTASFINMFQADSGRHMDVVGLYVGWETPFSNVQPSLNPIYQNGSTAMLTWQPDVYTTQISSANQTITNYITQFANAVKAYGHPILIRPMHEMNGNWYPHWCIGGSNTNSNTTYIAAWQYIVNIFRQVGATNASFIWCINNGNVGSGSSYTGTFPGEAYVDYLAIDGYNWGTTLGDLKWKTFTQVFQPAYTALVGLNQTLTHPKPIWITEWSSVEEQSETQDLVRDKAGWITDAFRQIALNTFPEITGLIWFNENQQQSDWRIESSNAVRFAYYQGCHSPTIDWATFGYNAFHTHCNNDELILNTSNVATLAFSWKVTTNNSVLSSPSVVNGIVYFGSQDNSIYAVDAHSGNVLWSYATGNSIHISSPAVANGVVYIGSTDSYLYALDATSGTIKWKFAAMGAIYSSPVVLDGVVYIVSVDGDINALSADSGSVKWQYNTLDATSFSGLAVADGVVYVGTGSGNVYAVNTADGTLRWKTSSVTAPGLGFSSTTPAVADDVIYLCAEDSHLYALSAESDTKANIVAGQVLWNYPTGDRSQSSPVVANGIVYFGSLDKNLYAVDVSTRQLKWQFTAMYPIDGVPAIANGVAYFGSGGTTFYAFDAGTGTQLYSCPLELMNSSCPAVVNGMVYIGAYQSLYAFALP